jgi:hypothetical protein
MKTAKSIIQKLRLQKSYNLISLPAVDFSEEEADRFIDYIVDQSVLKGFARVEKMGRPEKLIRAIGFGSGRFLYPADHFDETKYKKQFGSNKIKLATQKLRGCIGIFDDDLEDLPETMSEDEYKNQLVRIITAKIANELEEIYWIGETHGLNGFGVDDPRGLFDGWRWRITHSALAQQYYNLVTGSAHVLDACDGGTTGSPFSMAGLISEREAAAPYDWEHKYHQMLKAMPSAYKAQNGLAKMRFINSDLVTQDYIGALSSRSTGLGDAVLTGAVQPQYGRVGIVDAPLMATNLGDPATNEDGKIGAGVFTDSLLTPQNNFIIGIQREIRIESERKASDEATYMFYTMRVDLAIENVDAVVMLRCLEHNC